MQWHTQAGNITTNIKVEIDFTLTELSATNVVTRKFHLGESAKGRYAMILGRDILKELGLHLNDLMTLSNQMVDLLKSLRHPWLIWVCKTFKYLNTGKLTPEETFVNAYTEDNYE